MPRLVLRWGQQSVKVRPAWCEQAGAAQCHRSASGEPALDRAPLFHPLETMWVVCLFFAWQSVLRRCVFGQGSAFFSLSFMTLPASVQENKKATRREEVGKRRRKADTGQRSNETGIGAMPRGFHHHWRMTSPTGMAPRFPFETAWPLRGQQIPVRRGYL